MAATDCPALPKGWKREEVIRKNGLSSGKIDVFYYRYFIFILPITNGIIFFKQLHIFPEKCSYRFHVFLVYPRIKIEIVREIHDYVKPLLDSSIKFLEQLKILLPSSVRQKTRRSLLN